MAMFMSSNESPADSRKRFRLDDSWLSRSEPAPTDLVSIYDDSDRYHKFYPSHRFFQLSKLMSQCNMILILTMETCKFLLNDARRQRSRDESLAQELEQVQAQLAEKRVCVLLVGHWLYNVGS